MFVGSVLLCVSVACIPGQSETQKEIDRLERYLWSDVEEALNEDPPTPASRHLLLVRFLADAARNRGLEATQPLQIVPNGEQLESWIMSDESVRWVVLNNQYRFLKLRPNKEILVVFSSREMPLLPVSVDYVFDDVASLLPRIDQLLQSSFDQDWLHIQLFVRGHVNSAIGKNIFLSSGSENDLGVLSHELAHTFNRKAAELPVFLNEGIADLLRFFLTGSFGYRTEEPARIDVGYYSSTPDEKHIKESANGFLFFRELAEAVGYEGLLAAIADAYPESASADQFLSAILASSPDKMRVMTIFERWLNSYPRAGE
jgi:hypothetical protein